MGYDFDNPRTSRNDMVTGSGARSYWYPQRLRRLDAGRAARGMQGHEEADGVGRQQDHADVEGLDDERHVGHLVHVHRESAGAGSDP